MTISTKQKITNLTYVVLGFVPLAYLISFTFFLYYTDNGFGKELIYNPKPEKKKIYLSWLNVIQELQNFWIASFFLWVLMLIVTAAFLRNVRKKSLIIITTIVFIITIYIDFFSVYGGHEGWIGEYQSAVREINSR